MYDNDCVLDKDNYADYFHTLLYLDEYMAKQKMENYNMENVPLEIVSDTRLQLQVGLGVSYFTIWRLLTNSLELFTQWNIATWVGNICLSLSLLACLPDTAFTSEI